MSTTTLFDQAQLAEAAYANFFDNAGNLITTDAQLKTALTTDDGKFSTAQATDFVTHWKVISQYTAPPGLFGITDGTGFSGTVFKNITTNEYTFSLRGTEPGYSDLLGADAGDIVADGLALDQIMDMYNYWQSLTHTGVYQAKQFLTMTTETVALNAAYAISSVAGLAYEATLRANTNIIIDYPSRTVRTILSVDSTQLSDVKLQQGTGELAGVSNVHVDGHSLGGHLAMAFSRLFPNVTIDVTAVNGAGFQFANSNVDHLFSMLNGAAVFDVNKITNVVGSAALNLVSQDWLMSNSVQNFPLISVQFFPLFRSAEHGFCDA